MLVGVIVLGALGFAWVQQSGSPASAFESMLSSLSESENVNEIPAADAADSPVDPAAGDIPAPPSRS